ncbi:hypothetical protein, partial [Sandarakinorhabdus sp.]|uniref:hypothetical protein n=1 Tax=Sandarakinorhabdus sp. TaxID=1916663 RepID=UPI00334176A8
SCRAVLFDNAQVSLVVVARLVYEAAEVHGRQIHALAGIGKCCVGIHHLTPGFGQCGHAGNHLLEGRLANSNRRSNRFARNRHVANQAGGAGDGSINGVFSGKQVFRDSARNLHLVRHVIAFHEG